jgi:NADPH:quinone reductase-like Zn-dependent oxidoreductase
METMKAAVHTRYGPPEVVSVKDVPRPVPGDGEVLIRVHAATVNRTDAGFRSAAYFISRFWSGLLRPKQQTLGCEFAGQVEATGKNVTAYAVGDRVFGYDDERFGAHAEYLVMPENAAMAHIPEQMTYQEAAPLTEGAHYAWCDIRAAGVKAGQEVMVYGASGAIGSAAVQLLKHVGARVTAVCNTKNVELVRSLGADEVIDYTREDFTGNTRRFDLIFDAVGKSSFGRCRPLLREKGMYISTELGKGSENVFLALFTPLFRGKKVLFPLPSITREDVLMLKELAGTGAFRPVIDRCYPLDEIAEAYRYVETGQKTGNVVLTMR